MGQLKVLYAAVLLGAAGVSALSRISPVYTKPYTEPLLIPPVAQAATTFVDNETGYTIDYYELEVQPFTRRIFSDLGDAHLLGFNGQFPGPTFRIQKGRQSVVRVINRSPSAANLHLHGSYSRSPWDGFATDVINTDQYKDYYYPNAVNQRTLWYHDHTDKKSAVNNYKGLAGMYIIDDAEENSALGLPSNGHYDVPIILSSHFFTKDGDLLDNAKETASTYGDTYLVNGQIQPFMEAEAGVYRFRLLNSALSRVFNLTLHDDSGMPVEMSVIASDGGLRKNAVNTTELLIGMSERWEVLVDFSSFAGKNLTLKTSNMWTDKDYSNSGELMRFVVKESVNKAHQRFVMPTVLRTEDHFSTSQASTQRTITFDAHHDIMWGINGQHQGDAMSRVLSRPPLGSIDHVTVRSTNMGMISKRNLLDSVRSPRLQKRQHGGTMGGMMDMSGMANMAGHHGNPPAPPKPSPTAVSSMGSMGSMSMSGGGMMHMPGEPTQWVHVLHMHLVDVKIVNRRRDKANLNIGRTTVAPYEQDAIKDVALLGNNEIVEVLVRYQPSPGLYMMHCHNLIHEDHGMMGTFNITDLKDLGYDGLTLGLEDPKDERFAAKPMAAAKTDLEQIKREVLPFFASLKAYPDLKELEAAEDKYWSTHKAPQAAATPSHMGMGGMMGSM